MTDLSIVGLGNMGSAIARCLADNRKSITIWNRSPDKMKPLIELGAVPATTIGEAVSASPITIVCTKTHKTTTDMLSPIGRELAGKTIIDLSTGGVEEAKELVDMLVASGAQWQIGMINAYPSGIGNADTAILCAGPRQAWDRTCDVIKILGAASAHVGTEASAIPGLFAAMFTARQGFMFGLLYGGAVCLKAGVPIEVFVAQVPVTLNMARNYADLFVRTVPSKDFDNPGATVSVYLEALNDVMATFNDTNTEDALPRLMRDVTLRGTKEGFAAKELTSLVEMLSGTNRN